MLKSLFKYITCSYLSFYRTDTGNIMASLNTLHVLIYLDLFHTSQAQYPFKYITCSYLSRFVNGTFYINTRFKYITCSYLSQTPEL